MPRFPWPRSPLSVCIGTIAALTAWLLSQIPMVILWKVPPAAPLLRWSPCIIFPILSLTLALALTTGQVFLSNPTRPQLCRRRLGPTIEATWPPAFWGGLIAGFITLILLIPQNPLPASLLRVASWTLIGRATGTAEGKTWANISLEGGDKTRSKKRQEDSQYAGSLAGFAAGLLFEIIRQIAPFLWEDTATFQAVEEPLGFALLGALLGWFLSLAASPTYQAALRAGRGFEYYAQEQQYPELEEINRRTRQLIQTQQGFKSPPPNKQKQPSLEPRRESQNSPPSGIQSWLPSRLWQPPPSQLCLLGGPDTTSPKIEEGQVIQLPTEGRTFIGDPPGNPDGDLIRLLGLPPNAGHFEWDPERDTFKFVPNLQFYTHVRHNGRPCSRGHTYFLKHNDYLSFETQKTPEASEDPNFPQQTHAKKFYRLVYYNRFLDPET